jgi:hypothetical protein
MPKRDTTDWPQPRRLGYEAGYRNPSNLSSGRTYPDPDDNEEYDYGVNQGQHDGAADKGLSCQACKDGNHKPET